MRARCQGIAPEGLSRSPHVYRGPATPWGLWTQPLHVEIGTGKGTFLAQASAAQPEWGWVGVERAPGPLWKALRKQHRQQALLSPTRQAGDPALLWMDVQTLFAAFAPGEVTSFYINFPDPWPKRRHAARRLTHPAFLQRYATCLQRGGRIYLRTDHPELYAYSQETLAEAGWSVTDELPPFAAVTDYERRFRQQGIPILHLMARPPHIDTRTLHR